MAEIIKKNWHFAFYLFLSVFSILPLLSPGFFPMHDDTQVARIFEMGKSLSHGMFPVRWVEDLGYGFGYPIFNFYSVLPYYTGGILTLLGINALESAKLVFAIAIIGSGISMYFLAKEFFGKLAGVVSAVIYLYFPYHAVNIYVRGALAELSAYVFLPLVFLSFFKLHTLQKFHKEYVMLSALALAAVVLSHNLTTFMLLMFLGLFIVWSLVISRRRTRIAYAYVITILLAFLLSAFYSLPAILESSYTNISSVIGGGANPLDHFVCATQLWDSPWGFGGSAPGCVDGMSFKLGKLNILLLILALVLFITNLKKIKENTFIISFSFAGLLLSLFLSVKYSSILWRLPFMDFLQFPWRFLNFAGLFIALIIGYLIWQIRNLVDNKILSILAVIIVGFTLLYNVRLFEPKTIHDRDSSYYTNETYLKWTVSKISDEYMPKGFKSPNSIEEIKSSNFDRYLNPLFRRDPSISPFRFSDDETMIQKASNFLSVIGVSALILAIIGKRKIYGKKTS